MDFILTQKARKTGADKYTSVTDPTFSIYIPQTISRMKDEVHEKMKITVTPISD